MAKLSDEELATVMLGALSVMVRQREFPVEVASTERVMGINSFVLTTRSGLRYVVSVDLED